MTWKRDPVRHALASKGLKTSYGKLREKIIKDINKGAKNEGQKIEEDRIPPKELHPLDVEYGRRLTEKEKKEMVEDTIFAFWWASETDNWDYFPMDKVFDFLYDYMWEYVTDWEGRHEKVLEEEVDEFVEVDEQMMNTFSRLEDMVYNFDDYSKIEKINMIDDIIHTYHYNGTVFDIPSMRSKFEAYYGDYL